MANLTRISTADLLQDGVTSARATLFAIEAGGMLQNLPADESEAIMHNHALHLLHMLESTLTAIQAEIDARDAAA